MLMHLALDGKSADVRRNVNAVVARATVHNPILTNEILREALAAVVVNTILLLLMAFRLLGTST